MWVGLGVTRQPRWQIVPAMVCRGNFYESLSDPGATHSGDGAAGGALFPARAMPRTAHNAHPLNRTETADAPSYYTSSATEA